MVHSAVFWTRMAEFFCLSVHYRTWTSINLLPTSAEFLAQLHTDMPLKCSFVLEALGDLLQNQRPNKRINRSNRWLLFLKTRMPITKILIKYDRSRRNQRSVDCLS